MTHLIFGGAGAGFVLFRTHLYVYKSILQNKANAGGWNDTKVVVAMVYEDLSGWKQWKTNPIKPDQIQFRNVTGGVWAVGLFLADWGEKGR